VLLVDAGRSTTGAGAAAGADAGADRSTCRAGSVGATTRSGGACASAISRSNRSLSSRQRSTTWLPRSAEAAYSAPPTMKTLAAAPLVESNPRPMTPSPTAAVPSTFTSALLVSHLGRTRGARVASGPPSAIAQPARHVATMASLIAMPALQAACRRL